MKQLSFLIKPASASCNLRCKYCFYMDVAKERDMYDYGIMKEDTLKNLIDKALLYDVEQINFCFQGGEPTLAGIAYYQLFTSYVNQKNTMKKKITYAIQTNATLLNEEWIQLFQKFDFLVGVSLDGYMHHHDKLRVDINKNGTFEKVVYNIQKLEQAKIKYNVLTVLTKQLSKQPNKLYYFYKRNHIKYVQLIPCLPSLQGDLYMDQFALQPQDFAQFYKGFFDVWYQDYVKGFKMIVTLFDNMIPMFQGMYPYQCGMLGKCQLQFVVEGNGDVYPCDFYVLDKYKCGNICLHTIDELKHSSAARQFLNEDTPLCKKCKGCFFDRICYGNCRRQNVCYFDEEYCGYQDFLFYAYQRMLNISKTYIM